MKKENERHGRKEHFLVVVVSAAIATATIHLYIVEEEDDGRKVFLFNTTLHI